MSADVLFMKSAQKLLSASIIYATLVTLMPLGQWVFQDRYWLAAVASSFYLWFFIPLPGLLIRALRGNRRVDLIGLLVVAALGLTIWGPQFTPQFRTAQPARAALSVMSFNVLGSNRSYGQLVFVIGSAGPDLVGFQELNRDSKLGRQARLGRDYPHNSFDTLVRGVGLMSRYPILEVLPLDFPPRHLAIRAVVASPAGPIDVYVIHFRHNGLTDVAWSEAAAIWTEAYAIRAAEVAQFAALLQYRQRPVLLLCDCNMTETSFAYRGLSGLLGDSFREAGWGLGYTLHPEPFPAAFERIDYIWHSPEFVPLRASVLERGGSDHHPIMATFLLAEDSD